MSLEVTSLDWPLSFFRRFSEVISRRLVQCYTQLDLKSFKRAHRCTNVLCTETGDVHLRILHWLPLGTGGTGVCPIEMAIDMNWLRWLEGVAELRGALHSCLLSHLRQAGADFGPQLPAGAGLWPLKVVNHCGGTVRRHNIIAQQPEKRAFTYEECSPEHKKHILT